MISFIIVAFALFMIIKGMNKLKREQEEVKEEVTEPQVELLSEIRDLLKK